MHNSLFDARVRVFDVNNSLFDARVRVFDVHNSLFDARVRVFDVHNSLFDARVRGGTCPCIFVGPGHAGMSHPCMLANFGLFCPHNPGW